MEAGQEATRPRAGCHCRSPGRRVERLFRMIVQVTERQKAVLEAILSFQALNRYSPTLRELCEVLGIQSTNGVSDHLRALQKMNLVSWIPNQSRTLQVTRIGRKAAS